MSNVMTTLDATRALDQIKRYYGQTLQSKRDLKTGACCPAGLLPRHVQSVLPLIHAEIKEKFYGCGSPIPLALTGRTVLDLGCGTGRDVYVAAKMVGDAGRVIGVDMTQEQLEVARRHIDSQTASLGLSRPNVEFHGGYIEDLGAIGISDDSMDVVISNCVINLSPNKPKVFSEIFRVLKPGGELYFSDIFAGRRVPSSLAKDPLLQGECLGGALYIEDFRRLLRDLGCFDFLVTARRKITLEDPHIEAKVGMIDFYSMTIRAFKLSSLEDMCEDYGQVATYHGTIPECPHLFQLDNHHRFLTGKPLRVCGNTAAMFEETRYGEFFTVTGDRATHFGPFECSSVRESEPSAESGEPCC